VWWCGGVLKKVEKEIKLTGSTGLWGSRKNKKLDRSVSMQSTVPARKVKKL